MFSQEGSSFTNVGHIDEWQTYYLAQHHGIPTRLLDWTDSFAAALFFARNSWNGSATNPCVWVLRPGAVNNASINWPGIISPENYPDELGIWLPRRIAQAAHETESADGFTYNNENPIAIYPRRSNERIIAQSGYFTVHGRSKEPLDDFLERNGATNDTICRVNLTNADPEECKRDLERLGVRRSSIYPDIANFVEHMRGIYKW